MNFYVYLREWLAIKSILRNKIFNIYTEKAENLVGNYVKKTALLTKDRAETRMFIAHATDAVSLTRLRFALRSIGSSQAKRQ